MARASDASHVALLMVVCVLASAMPAAGQGTLISGTPLNVDSNTDCAIRRLAWDFAKKLLPQRGDFKSAYDALQLSACGVSLEGGRRYEQRPFRYQAKRSSGAMEVYVSATDGDDTNAGTLNEPVQTMQRAVEIYRSREISVPGGVIYVRGGTYYLTETLNLGPEDNNLIITGYKDEKVVISGGKEYVFTGNWREVVNEMGPDMEGVDAVGYAGESNNQVAFHGAFSLSECRDACEKSDTCFAYTWYIGYDIPGWCYFRIDGLWVPTQQVGAHSGRKLHVVMADLKDQDPKKFSTLFLNERRAVRARYPDGNPETMGLYTSPTGYVPSAMSWLPPLDYPPSKEIIESPQRYGTHFPRFQLGVNGSVQNFHPPESYWGTANPANSGLTYSIVTGLIYSSDEWIADQNWIRPDTGVVHAFHCLHWGNWIFAVDKQDKDKHQITFSKGGFQEARGCNMPVVNNTGAQWYVENIRELLDAPGEWYYNDENFTLFYYPKQSNSFPTSGVGTFLEQLISVKGSMQNPVMNITIANMTFTQTEPTYLNNYEVPSGGDWSIHRGGTVFVEGVDGFLLQNCIFDSPGGNALFLSSYVRNAVIEGNEFVYLGDSAIAAVGSTDLIDGTTGTQPRGTKVIGNLMHEIGVWGKQTSGYFQALAAETVLYGNVMFNGPRAGINFNDGFGGGHLVEMNLVFNMVRETVDNGPFNSWDRLPYLTKVKDGVTPSLTPAQSNMTRNFFICNYHSIYPIDHDDGSSYYYDTYNYLVYGGYKNNLGNNKVVKYNTYIYPDAVNTFTFLDFDYGIVFKPFCAWSSGDFPSSGVDLWANNTCIVGIYSDELLDLKLTIYEYLDCSSSMSNAYLIPLSANNSLYTHNKYFYIKCESETWSLHEFQDKGYDIGTQVYDLVDCDTIVGWGKDLLGLTWEESICMTASSSQSVAFSVFTLLAVLCANLFLL